MIKNKLNWISNEEERGSFLQIRSSSDFDNKNQYFITKSKEDGAYTLTIINDNIKQYFNTLEEAKNYAQARFDEWYFSNS